MKSYIFTRTNKSNQVGFTIIELIIVIVVIGILAGISVGAYRGYQLRAYNTQEVTVAEKYKESLGLYALKNGAYPPQKPDGAGGLDGTAGSACLGKGYTNGCYPASSSSADFDDALKLYMDSSLPQGNARPIPFDGLVRSGIAYYYKPTATLDGAIHPWYLVYHLYAGQKCSVGPVASGTWDNFKKQAPTDGITEKSSEGNATCVVPLDDPSTVVQPL